MNDLLGYLLKLDEPDERARTESRLREAPDAARELDALRRLVEPLEADREAPAPPPGLVARTIGLVAHHACGQSAPPAACPEAPPTRLERMSPKELTQVIAALDRRRTAPSRWRWTDLAVVAAILVVGVGLVLAIVPYIRQRHGVQACQNHMRQLYAALDTYASTHNESFPAVSETPPNNTAASYAAILRESGAMPGPGNFGCPAAEMPAFGTYAYSLGYRDETGALAGLRRDQADNDLLAIAGDRPALGRTTPNPDHRSGQNVLFVGGHVRYCLTGHVGVGGDDIYRNQELQVRAGVKLWDTVLGVAGDRP